MDKASGATNAEKSWRSVWSPRYTSACVAGLLLAGYGVALGRPTAAKIAQLHSEIARLEEERTALLSARSDKKSKVEPGPIGGDSFKARDLLPKISTIARRSGLKVGTIRQSPTNDVAGEREVRIVAQGAFPALVVFLDDLARALPQGRFEEVSLRQHSDATAIELESVLRTHVEEPPALVDGGEEGSS